MKEKDSTIKREKNKEYKAANLPQTEYDAILNSVPDIIIKLNLEEKVVWWNNKLEEIISLSSQNILNSFFKDLINQYDGESVSSFISETIDTGNAEIDALLITDKGERLYYFKSTLIENSNLDKKEILIVGRDVDERVQMSVSLKRSQAQLQTLIDTLPFLIFLTSPDNKYLLVNKKYCDFVGLSSEKIIGFKDSEIYPESISEYFANENNKVLSTKTPVQYEGIIEMNKSNVNLSIEKFPLFDEDNNIYAICGVAEDITTQYQLQRQLQQNQKMEAIGQLTGGIAHDFNNILASIMGYAGLIKRRLSRYDDETVIGYLNQVTRSGERARDLVQQLLAFSRGDVGGLQVLDPAPLAKEAIKMLSSLIPSSINLNLKIRANNVKAYIEVDPVQFHQSIMNLVINSKDAIIEEKGNIDVSLEYVTHVKGVCDSCHSSFSGRYIQLIVRDTGVGISKNIISRIFDPFFTTKEIGKGSGMGLSMLHGIVHGSGGHILINTTLNKGTTIKVFFPEVKVRKVEEKSGVYTFADTKKENRKINTGKNVLVVDDETLITNYLNDLLTDEGFTVISFNNAREAFQYYKTNYNDLSLIITDQTMPGLTGMEFAKKILSINNKIPIILCSGYSDLVDENVILNTGIDIFIEKPFEANILLGNINKLLIKYKE